MNFPEFTAPFPASEAKFAAFGQKSQNSALRA